MDILSYILGKKAGGGGGEAVLINKSISANGTYNASSDSADGYKKVEVAVPNSYGAGDEGKVVSDGALVAQGSDTVTENDTYDTTLISEMVVNVPNSYTAADEGKVVDNGTLVTQGTDTVTTNDTYDTTLIKSLTVNVSGGGGADYLAEAMNGTLTSYESNEVTQISSGLFRGYSYLTSIKIPNCERMQAYALSGTAITVIVLPKIQRLGSWAQGINAGNTFDSCTSLAAVDIGSSITDIGNSAFAKCSSLKTVVIRKTSVPNLVNINVFGNSPFASGGSGGTLYVPSSLISSYQGATNWSTILGYANNQIKAIENSIYETQYADGTPIS